MTLLHKLLWLSVLSFFALHTHADTLVLCDSMSSELKGESKAPGATGCVDVTSWTWGASAQISLAGGIVEEGKPSLSVFSLQKFVDSSSTGLFGDLVGGVLLKGTLQFREYGNCPAGCSSPTPYFTVDMTKAHVTAQSIGGAGDRPTESVSLQYDSVKLCYRTADESGTLGAPVCQTYTISTGLSS
jgi:type VI secretion system secreted protein Hcp